MNDHIMRYIERSSQTRAVASTPLNARERICKKYIPPIPGLFATKLSSEIAFLEYELQTPRYK